MQCKRRVEVGVVLGLGKDRVVALLIVMLGDTLGAAHGTLLSTPALLGMQATLVLASIPEHQYRLIIDNRQYVLIHALLLPQLLVMISVVCPPGPTNGSSLLELAICCSSCQQQPNHHGHSPPIVPAPAPHFLSNHSGRPNVSSARQPGPLLWPPPFEGRLNL